ncbi:Holliday junction branch migration protein RuvA [Macrococcus equipercicus]|uniref:Holliday junction branch migration complex subunit RuvA n=1 Tax=Macrococcus equipercicus TaxID=69967 RepID=A0A9Q9BRZ9_9STAP|nr:Holliday junction branch migration protein RuvA [Macrococcus equipercicus]KAA1040008.1 Holliday junction branch migration protein RuvA [Macrococcus equipercicus]UTH13059.1 Holliday junction branch migration protein RuvA [Macrococcus equipercicus]
MYAYLKGILNHIEPTHVVIDIGGVGYECLTPNPYRFQQHLNKELQIFTQLIVREDAHTLYGFQSAEEKSLFLSLIKVTGIGPKSALAILATSTPHEVKQAIEQENEAYLIKFPGIGKKTARQIILDLKGKLLITDESAVFEAYDDHSAVSEALLALEALGYSGRELAKVEKILKTEHISEVDANIKRGLQILVS